MKIKYGIGRESAKLIEQALYIRQRVFTDEQGFAAEIDVDQYDNTALHMVLIDNENPIAVLRAIKQDNQTLKIGRVAVLNEYRRKGVGRVLMNAIADYAREQNFSALILSAQYVAKEFYDSLGYKSQGEIYSEEGVDHIFMRLELA